MTNKIKTTSQLLFNEEPLVINRLGARVLGLNESIVIQQVHYWLEINRKAQINFHNGRTWTYNTYEQWTTENFDFWSKRTVQRVFKKLFDSKILLKGNFNKKGYDQTIWVTIDYDKLDEILTKYNNKTIENIEIQTEGQNVNMSNFNRVTDCHGGMTDCHGGYDKLALPIPETTTEINTEISLATQSADKPLVVNTNKELIENNTHLKLDKSKNMQQKVSKWDKDRLLKAIEIFKEKQGKYFSFLETIYLDDKNFVPKSEKTSNKSPAFKTRFHNINETFRDYEPQELEKSLKESQKDKFSNPTQTIDINVIRERAIDILQERINSDNTIMFKPTVRNNYKLFENEINEICNELLNK